MHSDLGNQYCSMDYQAFIQRHELRCGMSAKGNCYDNAVAESNFHTTESGGYPRRTFSTRALMQQTVFEYIQVDYNRTYRHSANGFISPKAFEAQQVA